MKRFYKTVSINEADGNFQIQLDGHIVKTQLGNAQFLPTRALAEAMAKEWRSQSDEIDKALFRFRDLADFALDMIAPDRAATIAKLLNFIETDTLCYRAEPDEPFYHRQQEVWNPLIAKVEASENVTIERTSGITHKPQSPDTLDALKARLEKMDDFALAALLTMTSLAASLIIGFLTNEKGANAEALWTAANLEEDWQIAQWGQDWEAEEVRKKRTAEFMNAFEFARLALRPA